MHTSVPSSIDMADAQAQLLMCGTASPAYVSDVVAFGASRLCQRPILVLILHPKCFGARLYTGMPP